MSVRVGVRILVSGGSDGRAGQGRAGKGREGKGRGEWSRVGHNKGMVYIFCAHLDGHLLATALEHTFIHLPE